MEHEIQTTSHTASINCYLESEYADIILSDSHLIWNLNSPIFLPENQMAQVAVTSFNMPNSMYIIDANNNLLSITVGGVTYNLTLSTGNYNSNELDTEIETQATAAFPVGTVLTVTYNGTINKYTFKIQTGGVDVNFIINDTTTCYKEIGINRATSYSYNGTQLLPNQVDLGGVTNVFLKCLNLSVRNRTTEGTISNTIAKIPIDVPHLGYIYMSQQEPIYFDISNRLIQQIDIKLENQRFQSLLIGGVQWGLTLTFRFTKLENNGILDDEIHK